MIKKIYLTIDDAPSLHTGKKIAYLRERDIPALFFCPGSNIEKHQNSVLELIKNGFLIGNHSYSHPHFSEIPLEECFNEVLKTEELIEKCYRLAKTERKAKVIRLPFGDKGGHNEGEIQSFLKKEGFTPLKGPSIDAGWDWDTRDYKRIMIQDEPAYVQALEEHYLQSSLTEEIILLHDFDSNHHLFQATMNFLQAKKVSFDAL